MTDPLQISIKNFTYDLPADKIALRPLAERDASKLLVYKNGLITEQHFSAIDELLPSGSLLVYNDTKVINARLHFKNRKGKSIEIFCLEPVGTHTNFISAMAATEKVQWKCFVGGAAKWKDEALQLIVTSGNTQFTLYANKIEQLQEAYIIEFSWAASVTFAEVLAVAGEIPLPPYIKRNVEIEDTDRYQTIFAQQQGSVAAPTAGLHFTEKIFTKLTAKNIDQLAVTLHVGAGTFKPVTAETMEQHLMHAEWIEVNIETLKRLFKQSGSIVAVGTTSLRTLETFYWLGVKVLSKANFTLAEISQWEPYEPGSNEVNAKDAIEALIIWMEEKKMLRFLTRTSLLIVPGYHFKIVQALVTNFHQPQSTLLLLVAAAIGDDWKRMYQYALANDFRFLSYGDANLVFI
ncbi:MAG: S-adenosylmethionine:tRNA ribosyltransferase-isomerase [Ferruginibacter sp.]